MSKVPPITHSFVEWQQAASSLLTLQTALSRSRRAVPPSESIGSDALEALVAQQQAIADGLYRIALAEAHEHVDSKHPAPAPTHRRTAPLRAQLEPCS